MLATNLPKSFLALIIACTLVWGCIPQEKGGKPDTKKILNAENDLLTEGNTIYFNSNSTFEGPVPKSRFGQTTDTLNMGATFSTSKTFGSKGTPLASVVDSITFVTEIQSNGGLNLHEVTNSTITPLVSGCDHGSAPISSSHGPWKYLLDFDSTVVISNCKLEINDPDCSAPSMEIKGTLVVVLTEGMPDDPGEARITNVAAWKNGSQIPTHSVSR